MKEKRASVASDVESDERICEEIEPIAPDGGWGWMVLLASFLSSVVVDGVCFSFGIFYLEFLDHFGANKGKTAWIGSVLNGMYMIMGPITGALANRYGCRPVAIVGSVWSMAAFFISTYSVNIDMLIVTYGVLGGMGFGLMYLPSIVVVGFYFDKKRAFATGLATCGSGIGAFIFAPMCQKLIETYAWQGAQWIIAAIVLNGIILGAMYRPLTERDMRLYREKWRRKKGITHIKNGVCANGIKSLLRHQFSSQDEQEREKHMDLLPVKYPSDIALNVVDKETACEFSSQPVIAYRLLNGTCNKTSQTAIDSWHGLSTYASMDSVRHTTEQKHGQTKAENSRSSSCMGPVRSMLVEIAASFDLTMLKNPVFVIYGISCILCMKGFFVPFIYLIDRAVELGYTEGRAAYLLSILGITNTVGRVLTGWISDRPWADCLVINNVALIVGGVATVFVPFCKDYILLAFYASIFGLCIAAFVSLRSIILVDLIGLSKLTSAFGFIVLCQGITSFVGAPIAGTLYDLTGTYDLSFYVAGSSITLAGLICLPLRRVARWTASWEADKTVQSSNQMAVVVS